jgi:septal ring factor EnvC (AmiA/AmiB activator)
LEELSLGTIPELENQSQNIQNILAELLQKRHEVDQGYSQLMAQKREFERNKNKSRSANDIARMADELETRIKRIRVKEEELANLEENIVKEKKDNLAKALMLQKAQKEFDESHDKKQTEIEAAAKKLEKLQVKLESAISLMNAKETELIGIKELMIEGKEKNMSSQLSK